MLYELLITIQRMLDKQSIYRLCNRSQSILNRGYNRKQFF
jgi:hypothetical protein